MGIYYMAVNHTLRQKINPHDLGDGAKIGEAETAKDLLWRLLAGKAWDARLHDIEVISDCQDERWARIDESYTQMTPDDGIL